MGYRLAARAEMKYHVVAAENDEDAAKFPRGGSCEPSLSECDGR
jgi:hypothetical protein